MNLELNWLSRNCPRRLSIPVCPECLSLPAGAIRIGAVHACIEGRARSVRRVDSDSRFQLVRLTSIALDRNDACPLASPCVAPGKGQSTGRSSVSLAHHGCDILPAEATFRYGIQCRIQGGWTFRSCSCYGTLPRKMAPYRHAPVSGFGHCRNPNSDFRCSRSFLFRAERRPELPGTQ